MATVLATTQQQPTVHRHVRDDNSKGQETADDGRLQGLDGPTLTLFYELLRSLQNSTAATGNGNVSAFQLKPIFLHNYLFFSFLYGLLGVAGVFLNSYFVWRSIRLRLYQSSLHYFLIHIAVTHFLASSLILPTSLAILLSQYWIFGDFMCYTLTMVQDLPSRVVLLLFVLIAVDRYRQFAYNSLDALPRHGCVIGVWLISACLAFPACVFVEFYDMYFYFKLHLLRGIGLCVVNNHSMEEYARAMFVVVYVVPLAVFAFAFTRISVELPKQEQPMILAQMSSRRDSGRANNGLAEDWLLTPGATSLDTGTINADVERRIQRYLTACGVVVALSSLPLNVMSVIQFGLTEDYADKSAMYDVTYAIFVWISFLPTVGVPALCLSMMSVAGCPMAFRLMRRWREGAVSEYVRRFSDFATTSAAGIVRLYPRMGHGDVVINSSDTTMTSLRQRSQSIISARSTLIGGPLPISDGGANANKEKRYLAEESLALMRRDKKGGRRSSMASQSEVKKSKPRRASLAASVPTPTPMPTPTTLPLAIPLNPVTNKLEDV